MPTPRLIVAVALWAAVLFSPLRSQAAPPGLYDALPASTQALVAFEDLRAWSAEFKRGLAIWHSTEAGKAHLERGGWLPLLDAWLDALGPKERAAAALVMHMDGGEPEAQLVLRADPDSLTRLAQLSAELPFSVVVSGPQTITLAAGDMQLSGRLGPDGFLRIGLPGSSLAPPAAPLGALPGRVGKRVHGRPVAVWLQLAGPVGQLLQAEAEASARKALSGLTALGASVDFSAGEWQVDMVVEHAALPMFKSLARRADLKNHFLPLWGGDATTIASLSLPPVLFQQAAEGIASDIDVLPDGQSTQEVAALLAKLDGRIGFAGFQSPGDWALAFRTGSADSSQQLLSSLKGLIEAAADMAEVKADELLSWGPTGFHLRPDPALHGLVGFARGADIVFATDTRRVATLRTTANKAKRPAQAKRSHARHWTPRIKALMDRPAMLLVYMLYPDAHDLYAMMSWAMGGARVAWHAARPPEAAFLDGFVDGLALTYAAAAVQGDMLYDFGMRLDLEDGLLVLQTAASEL